MKSKNKKIEKIGKINWREFVKRYHPDGVKEYDNDILRLINKLNEIIDFINTTNDKEK